MNVEAIKKIMCEKTYISAKDIMVLTGCSSRESRKIRLEVLATYMPIDPDVTLKVKVRIDKFLEYYNNKTLTEIYHNIINNGKMTS